MKLVHKDFERDGGGRLVLIAEEAEDMWHTYNLVMEGDCVRASTVRYSLILPKQLQFIISSEMLQFFISNKLL